MSEEIKVAVDEETIVGLDYFKNHLILECLEVYYATFRATLDTEDFVPKRYHNYIVRYIAKHLKRQFWKIDLALWHRRFEVSRERRAQKRAKAREKAMQKQAEQLKVKLEKLAKKQAEKERRRQEREAERSERKQKRKAEQERRRQERELKRNNTAQKAD